MKKKIALLCLPLMVGCASLTNDPYIPMILNFSDNSEGTCSLRNKRFFKENIAIPSTIMVRRSDDDLILDCQTSDGRKAMASAESKIASEFAASIFLDLGITDSITDKHRYYPSSFTIPVKPKK